MPSSLVDSLGQQSTQPQSPLRHDTAERQLQEQEEMIDDIVDNTNPVFAALANSEDLIMANLYIHPS